MNNSELWYLSSFVQRESFFQSQMKSVGIQKSKFMERYEKNMLGARRSNLYTNLFMSLYLLINAALPIIALIHLNRIEITSSNITEQLFSNSFLLGTYFLINFVYYFIIGFLPMMEFLQGKTFKYLRTLPLTSKDIQKITIFTVIRMNGIQLLVIIFSVPVAIFLFFRNILLVSVILFVDVVNAIFMFYFFLIISNYLSIKVFNNTKSSKLFTIIRITISLLYIVSIFAISFFYQFIPTLTSSAFISKYFGSSQSVELNVLASFILFPITSGYIILLVAMPTKLIPLPIIISSIVAILCFLLFCLFLLRKGNKILSNLSYEEIGSIYKEEKSNIDPESVKIKVSTPKVAYIKRIFIMATREQGKLVIFILPILFPIIFAFSFSQSESSSLTEFNPFIGLFFCIAIIPYLLNTGLSEAEEGLGGLLSVLPIKTRDIFRSKQYIMTGVLLFSSIIYIIIIGVNIAFQSTESMIKIFFLAIFEPTLYLLLFSILFGKINGKFTSFKVNTSNSTLKYIILIGSQMAIIALMEGITVPNINYLIALNMGLLVLIEIITRFTIK